MGKRNSEDENFMKLTQDNIKHQALIFAVFNLRILLTEFLQILVPKTARAQKYMSAPEFLYLPAGSVFTHRKYFSLHSFSHLRL
jgi:hypothetical protein